MLFACTDPNSNLPAPTVVRKMSRMVETNSNWTIEMAVETLSGFGYPAENHVDLIRYISSIMDPDTSLDYTENNGNLRLELYL